ncbi:MAG: bifunctional methylenetetrahydrofolate dehydrogenase/methenyltetrahydrofolate cyclohydrolase [Rickettsiales bacterium]|jgi:methylenetetrahydrofolate dehydrogenase (NADP+)/methenyltetrahydrofolate cyclohydrolase|nr:bifunctional methylenetetrahydrofolate dehydrogenase/methenyltetrahydrofolate cyclohydrolase [Rickettsiales bacterium]
MSSSKLIDGKLIASQLRKEIAEDVARFYLEKNITPGLAVILVGEHPASKLYVRNKIIACKQVGIALFEFYLPYDISEELLIKTIEELNRNNEVHGILVQLPLPEHINATNIINSIDPEKDVDGFTPTNLGKLVTQQECFVPCTPQGCLILIKSVVGDLDGLSALVIGRSNIVGKPMFHVLLQENCTVTLAHSYTRNLEELCKKADILVVAVGNGYIIPGAWIKTNSVVIDVGISYDSNGKVTGDVEFEQAAIRAKAISPVPYGVGPMTITCLLKNTLKAAVTCSID